MFSKNTHGITNSKRALMNTSPAFLYYRDALNVLDFPCEEPMKILSLPTIGVLSFALAGCIARDDHYDHDHSIHHQSDSSSESSTAVSSSSAPVVTSSSEVIVSSSSEVIASSSMAPMSSSSVMSSSSAPVIVMSSSSVMSSSVMSSSSVVSSSSAAPVSSSSVASSSAPAVNIEDLTFSASLKEDKTITTDSVANLGTVLLGLIDKDAFDQFYLSLIAQGLDEAALKKAVSVLGPISTAIGADFIKAFSGQDLLPAPAGINLVSQVTPVGSRGVNYGYTVTQTIDDVAVVLKMSLRFERQVPTLSALIDGRTGYNVFLDGLNLVVNELTLTTSDVAIALNTANPVLASSDLLDAQVELTPDGTNIKGVTFNGEALMINISGRAVNGIIGVDATGGGSVGVVNATIDLATGSSSIKVTAPDVTVQMQGVDTQN